MAPLAELDVDIAPALRAIEALGPAVERRVLDACEATAAAIAREAKSRLARQLGPHATGQTVEGITYRRSREGVGFVVLADNERQPNLPLWLEKGTKPGKRRNFARTAPRPFFYASVELEAPGHERRLAEALGGAAHDVGLGG